MDLNLEALTVQLIEKYYANDRRLFFEYMDDDIIWIGPAIRQYIEGKQNLLNAFAQESHSLQFRTASPAGDSVLEKTQNRTISTVAVCRDPYF